MEKKENERLKKEQEEREKQQMIKKDNKMGNQEEKGQNIKNIVVNVKDQKNEMIKKIKKEPKREKVIVNIQELNSNNVNMSQVSKLSGNSAISHMEDSMENKHTETKVGKLLAEKTTKRVIILVFSMMIAIILFNSSFYIEEKTGMEYGLKVFTGFKSVNDPNFNLTFSIYVNQYIGVDNPIIYARVGYLLYGDFNQTLILRSSDKNSYAENCTNLIPSDPNNSVCEAVFDIRDSTKLSALLNIIKTLFICFILSYGSYIFSKDTTE